MIVHRQVIVPVFLVAIILNGLSCRNENNNEKGLVSLPLFSSSVFLLPDIVNETTKINTGNICIGDLDGDQKPDILVSKPTSNEVVWLSKCEDKCDVKHFSFSKGPVRSRIVDFDQDGDQDIIVTEIGELPTIDTDQGQIIMLENDGSNNFSQRVLVKGMNRVVCAESGDLDNDGDLDLVACEFGFERGMLVWFEQKPDFQFIPHILDARPGTIHAYPYDFDNDGDLDIATVLSQTFEEINFFRNNGKGKFTKENMHSAGDPCFGYSSIELVDLDQDGHMDVLATNGDLMDGAPVITDKDGQKKVTPLVPGLCENLKLAAGHGVVWFKNDGAGIFTRRRLANSYAAYALGAADFDNDGDTDLALASFSINLYDPPGINAPGLIWLENDGNQNFNVRSIPGTGFPAITLAIGDINQDNRPDILVGSFDMFALPGTREGHTLAVIYSQVRWPN